MTRWDQSLAYSDVSGESPAHRLRRYRENSTRAEEFALKSSNREFRKAYRNLAESWRILAEDVERLMQSRQGKPH